MFSTLLRRPTYQTLNQIYLSSSALKQNLHFFRQLQPHTAIAPVLKSNAYGHGLVQIGKLLDKEQAPFLVVDSLYEAYELHKQHIRTPILIMGFTHHDNFKVKRLPFHTVVYDLEMVRVLAKHQPQMKLHLKIDTGMNRQGVKYTEVTEFLEQVQREFPRLQFEGVCTHLSDADNPSSQKFTALQLERFLEVLATMKQHGFKPKWRHVANTAGTVKVIHPEINMIRLGIGLYGLSPLSAKDPAYHQYHFERLRPVLRLETTLAQMKLLSTNETVGYNNTFKAKKMMTIGILPIGYYDGVDRRLSNVGCVTIDGVVCPILGRVSMNITVVDISQVPHAKVGDQVVVYSEHPAAPNSLQHAADLCKTIPYELGVHLAESVRRVTV